MKVTRRCSRHGRLGEAGGKDRRLWVLAYFSSRDMKKKRAYGHRSIESGTRRGKLSGGKRILNEITTDDPNPHQNKQGNHFLKIGRNRGNQPRGAIYWWSRPTEEDSSPPRMHHMSRESEEKESKNVKTNLIVTREKTWDF